MQSTFETDLLRWIYRRLLKRFGKRHWWPARSRFEVMVGAILTQGTAWSNVERAIHSLRQKRCLNGESLYRMDEKRLAQFIRPSGFFRVKARRLKSFLTYLYGRWQGDVSRMLETPSARLRQELLSVPGLGKETADSILLYAGEKPVFVVDAYTRRIFSRHGLLPGGASYDEMQQHFMKFLPHRTSLFNEYHALLVEVGKRHCRATAHCQECPLDPLPRSERACRCFIERSGVSS